LGSEEDEEEKGAGGQDKQKKMTTRGIHPGFLGRNKRNHLSRKKRWETVHLDFIKLREAILDLKDSNGKKEKGHMGTRGGR